MKLGKFVLRDDANNTGTTQTASATSEELTQAVTETAAPAMETEVLANATKAFSIVQVDGHWMVLELEVDVANKRVGQWKLVTEDGSKSSAIERFKINVAETLM